MKTKIYNSAFESFLKKYNIPQTKIIYVESVKDWAVEHGIPENNPFRVALNAKEHPTGIHVIVILEEMGKNNIPLITSALRIREFPHWRELNNDLELFIKHTFLHEIAHIKFGTTEEKIELDNWAWDELRKLNNIS